MGHLINPIIFKISYSNIWNDFFFCNLNSYSFIINKLYEFKIIINLLCADEFFVYNDLIFNNLNICFSDNKFFVRVYFYDAGLMEISQNFIFSLKFSVYYDIMKSFWNKKFSDDFSKSFLTKYFNIATKGRKFTSITKLEFNYFVNFLNNNIFKKTKLIYKKSKIFLKFLFIILFFFFSIRNEEDLYFQKYIYRLIRVRKTDFNLLFLSSMVFVNYNSMNNLNKLNVFNLLKWYKFFVINKYKIFLKKSLIFKNILKKLFINLLKSCLSFLSKNFDKNNMKFKKNRIVFYLINKKQWLFAKFKKFNKRWNKIINKLDRNLNYSYSLYYGIFIIFNLLSDKYNLQDNYNMDKSFLSIFSSIFIKRVRSFNLELFSKFFRYIFRLKFIDIKFFWFLFDNDSLKSKLVSHHIAARIDKGFRFKFFMSPLRRELRFLMKQKPERNYEFVKFNRRNAFHYLKNYYSFFKYIRTKNKRSKIRSNSYNYAYNDNNYFLSTQSTKQYDCLSTKFNNFLWWEN